MIDAIGRPQSVLVLGGSSEIAQAIVTRLVPGRCRTVVLAGREGPRLSEAVARAKGAGAEVAEAVAFDATDTAHHHDFADQVFARFGDIDLVVVAAGVLGDQDADASIPRPPHPCSPPTSLGWPRPSWRCRSAYSTRGTADWSCCRRSPALRARKANFIYGSSKAGLDAFCPGPGRLAGRHRSRGHHRAARVRRGPDDGGHGPGPVRHHARGRRRRGGGRRQLRGGRRLRPAPAPLGVRGDAPSAPGGVAEDARLTVHPGRQQSGRFSGDRPRLGW